MKERAEEIRSHLTETIWLVAEAVGLDRNCPGCVKSIRKIDKRDLGYVCLKHWPKFRIDEALKEWSSKQRRMGCVSASNWFCDRVPGFKPERLVRHTPKGTPFDHVVATNGIVRIDLAPHADGPDEEQS